MAVVAVLGVHRAGTSLTARALAELGVELGSSETLMGAGGDNRGGFWEQEQIVRLNEGLLRHLGGRWLAPPPLQDGWARAEALEGLVLRAEQVLAEVFDRDAAWWGWKDPRTSLTLPFWRRVVTVERTVLCLRDPREVAASLGARNDLDDEWGAALWLWYVLAALSHAPDALIVDYADYFLRPSRVIASLAAHLDVPVIDVGSVDFIRSDLRHHATMASASTPLLGFALELHERLVSGEPMTAVAWSEGVPALPAPDRETALAWAQMQVALRRVAIATIGVAEERDSYRAQAQDLRRQRDEIRSHRDAVVELAQGRTVVLAAREQELAATKQEIEESRHALRTLRHEVFELRERLRLASEELMSLQGEIDRFRREAGDRAAFVARSEEQRREAEATVARLRRQIDALSSRVSGR